METIIFIRYCKHEKKFFFCTKGYRTWYSIEKVNAKDLWEKDYPNCIYLDTITQDPQFVDERLKLALEEVDAEFKKYRHILRKLDETIKELV